MVIRNKYRVADNVAVAPIIHFVRHAQGYHNISIANHRMHDPLLTPKGVEECQQLSERFPNHDSIGLLVASPLRRTLYTALLSFIPEVERGIQVIALPELQEISDLPSDTGSDAEPLKLEMKGKPVDLSLVHEGWNNKLGKWDPTEEAIEARVKEARQWLKSRPEKEIVVVTHGGLLHYLTEDWTDSGTGWENAEFRSYQFTDEEGDDASMTETAESCHRRRGTEKPLTQTERLQLRETAKQKWESQGYQIPSKA